MTQKVRKTLIMVVMAALIICLMAASLTYTFTYGRYAGGKFDEEKTKKKAPTTISSSLWVPTNTRCARPKS